MNLAKVQELLKSIEPQEGQAEEMHGWRFDEPLDDWIQHVGTTKGNDTPRMFKQFKEYLMERCRRAESLQIPDLKEKVKAAVLAGMDAMEMHWVQVEYGKDAAKNDDSETLVRELRALCAPDSPPSETNREEVKG